MGYSPDDYGHNQIGPKFAGATRRGIKPNDVILIARRHDGAPEIVGFGVVRGEHEKLKEGSGSLRKLLPFKPWSRPPSGIPLIDVLQHTKALVELHPDRNGSHRKVCEWIKRQLSSTDKQTDEKEGATTKPKDSRKVRTSSIYLMDLPESHQLDYKVQTKSKVISC